MGLVGSRYRLGLSATLSRKDGLDSMLHHVIGPVVFHANPRPTADMTVHIYPYPSPPSTASTEGCVDIVSALAADGQRTMLLVSIIRHLHTIGRNVLVMSDRRQQLATIASHLAETSPAVPVIMAVGGGGASSHPDESTTRPVVLATYAYAAEGMDIPRLDTCVFATPRVDICQCVGRILRDTSATQRLVCDVRDSHPAMLTRQCARRRKWLMQTLGATVMVMHLDAESFAFQCRTGHCPCRQCTPQHPPRHSLTAT
jgi:hypothetical protein